MLLLVVVLALPIASVAAAPAGTVLVDGSDTTADVLGCGTKANPCNTIQAGIDDAVPGDTVRVSKGTYAGAVVNKSVHLEAHGPVIINAGPFYNTGTLFRAGFVFDQASVGDRSGSGTSIEGFQFVGAMQAYGAPDDGLLDFAVFSRAADNVSVRNNSLTNMLQGITDWNGAGWTIESNTISDLWTYCGGGIGIIVGGYDGVTPIHDSVVSKNVVSGALHVDSSGCDGYSGDGIVLYADFRFGRLGAPLISGNELEQNRIALVSDAPTTVNAIGIELTVAFDSAPALFPTVITGNLVDKNDVRNMSGNGIVVSDGSRGNTFDKNQFRADALTDAVDQSTGVGTAGTANSWTGNHCDTSSPDGLCK